MSAEKTVHKPLSHFRVLDLTNVLAGPFCCHQLAHLGAEVIKVEMPGSGDLARQLGADAELNKHKMGISFLAQNAGKQSMTLNLKSDQGKAIFLRLVETVDVVVENFRPGVMQRLGLSYETLKGHQPNLVYCAISGFGQHGPLSQAPAYDQIIQGMSGVMSITGSEDTAPYRVGYPVADTVGGMTAAFAIAAALAAPDESRGGYIDIAMLEAMIATMGWAVSNYLIGGVAPQPMGNQNVTACPSGAFRTEEGLLNIAANKQEQFETLCDLLELPQLKTDKRFRERQDRLNHRQQLNELIEQKLITAPATKWQELFNQHGIPAGCVLDVPDALSHAHMRHRKMQVDFEQVPGVDKTVSMMPTAVCVDDEYMRVHTPPPILGQHTEAILSTLGYGADDIKLFKQQAII